MGCLALLWRVTFLREAVSYQVIARKWRPQSFKELVGQDHIAQTISNALCSGRLPHALLFTGPRGTGKTSSARILAKSLRCPHAENFTPCHTCSDCVDIAQGRSLDVIEIDGASNNGVDAIRELRDTVGYMPSSGKHKIYIIDEVHMLSSSAFNALLKTLEEPPSHVTFVMATTEAQKIPNTILSRCQRFDFRTISTRRIAEHLQYICKKDGVSFEPEALWAIARQAGGSMRDGQSLLDQTITYCNDNIRLESVVESLGLTDRQLLTDTLCALVNRDSARAMDVIRRLSESGLDSKIFAHDLLEELRNLLFVKTSQGDSQQLIDLPDSEIETLRELGQELGEEDIHLLFDMCLKGVQDLHRTQDSRIVLEILLLRIASAPRVSTIALLAQGAQTSQQRSSQQKPSQVQSSQKPSSSPLQDKAPPNEKNNNETWSRFVQQVKASNAMLGAMLESTFIIEITASELKLGLPQKMAIVADQIKSADNIKRIETFLRTFWQKTLSVSVEIGDSSSSNTPKSIEKRKEQARKEIEQEQVEHHPLVKSVREKFTTEIVSIKEKS